MHALVLAALFALPPPAGTLSVSPAVVMLRGTSGQSTTQRLTMVNNTAEPMTFAMQAKDVVVREGKRVFVDGGELPGSIAATAVFSPRQVTVAPGEKAIVDITVTLPTNPGSRAIVAVFHGLTKIKQGSVSVTGSVGTLLTFALSDGSAHASPLVVKPPTASSNLSVSQHLVNDSSEPVLATGVVAIVNRAGALVAKEALPPRRLLPGEGTEVSAQYGGDLPRGHYRALMTYDLQNNHTLTSSAEFDVK